MGNHRFRAETFLAAIAVATACGMSPTITSAQDKPAGSDDGRPPGVRYGPRSAVPSLSQRSRYTALRRPANSIHVTVHYPDTYGYRHAAGLFDSAPNSCDAFSVSIVPAVAPPNQPVGIHVEPAMRRASGLYWCEYSAEDLPLDVPIDVRVKLGDAPTLATEAWMGGIEPQPPAGQRRVIGGDARTVVLHSSAPGAEFVFWMDYAAQPAQLQRLRQPLQHPLPRIGPPVPEPETRHFRRALPVQENTSQRPGQEDSSDHTMQPRTP